METFNIYDLNMGLTALNAREYNVVDIVRPWFADVAEDKRVRRAVEALANPKTRQAACEYLGVHLEKVA